jgi:hypothetical protein
MLEGYLAIGLIISLFVFTWGIIHEPPLPVHTVLIGFIACVLTWPIAVWIMISELKEENL